MLVLSRKRGEKIYIGDHITIQIVDVRGGSVRLGVEAPTSVPIERPDMRRPSLLNRSRDGRGPDPAPAQ